MNGTSGPPPFTGPITPDLLADLQAGLLDDTTAARVRKRVRTDPDAAALLAALDQVRRDLADFGADTASAPSVPPEVSARVVAAVRASAGHTGAAHRWRLFGAIAGGCAAVLAVGLGVGMLLRGPAPSTSSGLTSLGRLTVSPPPTDVGLSEPQILGLLSARPDLGPLTGPGRLQTCLGSLGYPPGVRVLGARPLDVAGRAGVLILLPADTPDTLVGLVVPADCDAAHTGLLANTVVKRP